MWRTSFPGAAEIEMKFVRPPERTHDRPSLLFGKDWVAVTTLNVGRIEDIGRAEEEALATAKDVCAKPAPRCASARSPRRTPSPRSTRCHGLVRFDIMRLAASSSSSRALTDRPYSPIPSRSREAQNYGAAFNAGVVASYLIERVLANPDLLDPPAAPIKLAKPAGADVGQTPTSASLGRAAVAEAE